MSENGNGINIAVEVSQDSQGDHLRKNNDLSDTDDSQEDSLHENMDHDGNFQNREEHIDFNLPLKQVLFAVNKVLGHRLDAIENQLDNLNHYCQTLEQKVESLAATVRDHNLQIGVKRSGQAVIVGVPHGSSGSSTRSSTSPYTTNLGPSITLITLNTEADYPQGSWLGDENNPEMRVRCHITPTDLLHINTTCNSAEKMALTLLDYLFDRETQAISNISGTGKHKKKQLDPLLIYGIRCHLIHKFGITEKDWHRIKQNMDSKCRTAFRRKMKGLSVNTNSVHDSESELSMDQTSEGGGNDMEQTQTISLPQTTISVMDSTDLTAVMQGAQVIHTPEGDIQVLHATPEQIAQIQQTHQIQILTGEHMITTSADSQIIEEIQNDSATKDEIPEDDEDNAVTSEEITAI